MSRWLCWRARNFSKRLAGWLEFVFDRLWIFLFSFSFAAVVQRIWGIIDDWEDVCESGGNWKSLRFYFIGKACSRVQILYYLRNFVVIIFASFPNLIFRYFYSPNNTLHSSATILARFQNKIQQDFTTLFLRNNNQAALFCRATSFSSLLSTKSRFPSLNPLVNPPTQTTRPTPQGTP